MACVIGDGEAETGPLAASWHSNKFLNPVARRRGAADPAPQRLQDRQSHSAGPHPASELEALLGAATATPPYVVDGRATTRPTCTSSWPRRWTTAFDQITAIQQAAARDGESDRPRWPMIILRTPKGWTGPHEVDGKPVEGTWRSHQVPLAEIRDQPVAPGASSRAGCAATGRRNSSTPTGHCVRDLRAARSDGHPADERQPARQRRAAAARPRPAGLPRLRGHRAAPRCRRPRKPPGCSARSCATSSPVIRIKFRLLGPDETASNRLAAVFEKTDKAWQARRCPSTRTWRRTAG